MDHAAGIAAAAGTSNRVDDDENECGEQDDRSSRRNVGVVADDHTDSPTGRSDEGGDHEHAGKRVRHHAGDDRWGHQQCADEQNTDDLHREENGDGEHEHEQRFHAANIDASDIGNFRIERCEKKLAVKGADDGNREQTNTRDGEDFKRRNTKDGAEKDRLDRSPCLTDHI